MGGVVTLIILAALVAFLVLRLKQSRNTLPRTRTTDEEMLSSLASSQMTSTAGHSFKGQVTPVFNVLQWLPCMKELVFLSGWQGQQASQM